MSAIETRRQIVEAADTLFYENGFVATSFADIAKSVGLSRGNFYYHFKTKDEILGAVIDLRLSNTQAMLDAWQEAASPAERIKGFIDVLIVNRVQIMKDGCPVGTLANELAKLDHAARRDAARVFALFRGWLRRQFIALGRESDADELALHVLMRSQGIATLAAAFRDETFIRREVEDMKDWVAGQIPSRKSR